MQIDEEIEAQTQMISLVAFEAQAERHTRIVRGMAACWMLSVFLFSTALIILLH